MSEWRYRVANRGIGYGDLTADQVRESGGLRSLVKVGLDGGSFVGRVDSVTGNLEVRSPRQVRQRDASLPHVV